MRILVIDENKTSKPKLFDALKPKLYFADFVSDITDGITYALTDNYDLIVIVVNLPALTGIATVSHVRSEGMSTPILLVSNPATAEEKAHGLDAGADDYICEPFETVELLARIRALTRRCGFYTGDDIVVGDITLKKNLRVLEKDGKTVSLTAKEYEIAEMLFSNSKQIISKDRFFDKIWGSTDTEYNNIEVYISFLRKKLKKSGSEIKIRSVRGLGYGLQF